MMNSELLNMLYWENGFQNKILHISFLRNIKCGRKVGLFCLTVDICKICETDDPLFATYSLTNSTLDEFQSMLVFHKPKNIGDKIKQVLPFLPALFQDYLE